MNKPSSLRAALVAEIPSLTAEPDKLTIFVDEGSIAATGTRSLSFEYRYTVHVLVMDFAGDADAVFIALVQWARAHQPDLVTNADARESGITFEVDILNNSTVDLSVKLQLTESVVISTDLDGKRTVTHVNDAAQTWVAV
jgi:hypothetical protein